MNADMTMRPVRAFGCALLGLAIGSAMASCPLAPPVLAAPADAWDAEFNLAQTDYEANRWRAAYERLARIGDQGHPEAARIVLLMWRHGPALYGQRFDAAPARRELWVSAASRCGLA